MEAKQILLSPNVDLAQGVDSEEQRLQAIKRILVGNQIERIENRFKGLSRRVETNSTHLTSAVEGLKAELKALKAESQLNGAMGVGSEDRFREILKDFADSNKGATLAKSEEISALENRMSQLESALEGTPSGVEAKREKIEALLGASEKRLDSIDAEIAAFKNKMRSSNEQGDQLSQRVGRLEEMVTAQDTGLNNDRLRKLEAQLKALREERGIQEVEQRMVQRQGQFENEVQDLLERLAGRVNERFDFAKAERKDLGDAFLGLNKKVEAIQDILETEVLEQLKNGGNSAAMVQQLEKIEQAFETRLREQNIRLETKLDTIMEMSSRQAQFIQREDPKKAALRETLKKLSDLLDE